MPSNDMPSNNMPTKQPVIAQKAPFAVAVEGGKSYWWCACGKSASQPFCDGSHKGSEFSPVEYKAEVSGTVFFCGCKHSAKGALCDGTHKKL
jgi:CDGSH iron-sulfur domain-containing protein 3